MSVLEDRCEVQGKGMVIPPKKASLLCHTWGRTLLTCTLTQGTPLPPWDFCLSRGRGSPPTPTPSRHNVFTFLIAQNAK